MHFSQLQYLPLSLPFFSILVGIFFLLLIFIQVGVLRYAYMRLGLSSGGALLLLLSSLVGSYFNIPVAELPGEQVEAGREITYFGMHYVVPLLVDWPGTVIAVNVGGAVIPMAMSVYLVTRYGLFLKGLIAVLCVAGVCYSLAEPIQGLGIALPIFVPVATTGIVALVLSRERAAPLAYIAGSLGTLLGADILNLDKISGLGTPMASIGGAGTFDGIFLNAVLAVLIASIPALFSRRRPAA
ncbi:MAG: DUF1614 domain-containing protein [Methylobacteriaceae bacterium]|nr:DUF1614 domain-containing protein [Methylobacteriaceae bacterium]